LYPFFSASAAFVVETTKGAPSFSRQTFNAERGAAANRSADMSQAKNINQIKGLRIAKTNLALH
jgi:hypothetical protein